MPDSPTHILYVAEYSTGGSVESLLCLVGGLDRAEFEATVLFYSMPEDRTRERFESTGAAVRSLYPYRSNKGSPKEFRKLRLQSKISTVLGTTVEQLYESLKYVLYFLRFRRSIYKDIRSLIRQTKPDLVHANNGAGTDTPGILAARAENIPAVCHIRTFGKLTYPSVVAARSVGTFLCISTAVRDWLLNYGIESERCVVVPNAVDPLRFNETAIEPADIRAEFGWDNSDKIFVLAGRVVSWKGHDFFIQAVAEARKRDASVQGLIVGAGDRPPDEDLYLVKLQSLVGQLGLEDNMKFAGHRTDIPNIMKSADAVICASSLPEPFGRVIIESMAVGTPAIATDAGGTTDIITDGVNGLLVPAKDGDALAQAIVRISQDEDLAQHLRSAAIQSVADRYTVNRHVDQVCDIYRSVLKATRA